MLREVTVSQLRWTLLILGGVFIGALAVWERLRPRQARGREPDAARPGGEPVLGGLSGESPGTPAAARAGEPWIADERLETAVPPEEPWQNAAPAALADLPTVLIDEPRESSSPTALPVHASTERTDEWEALEEGVGEVRIITAAPLGPAPPAERAAPAATAEPPVVESAVPQGEPPLRVEWPPESERHIVALRLVAAGERFPGRTLRLALAAEGFRPGRFDIFHKGDENGLAIVSAASLMRPGTFDPTAMDSQRYAGLNLFTVLPGPLPAAQALEALIGAAQNLNERLQGEVQDEHGERLTGERIAELRAALGDGSGGALP
jgi:FtsZ-interacting cell division protein ZipA